MNGGRASSIRSRRTALTATAMLATVRGDIARHISGRVSLESLAGSTFTSSVSFSAAARAVKPTSCEAVWMLGWEADGHLAQVFRAFRACAGLLRGKLIRSLAMTEVER